jgi:hypothetical protein
MPMPVLASEKGTRSACFSCGASGTLVWWGWLFRIKTKRANASAPRSDSRPAEVVVMQHAHV